MLKLALQSLWARRLTAGLTLLAVAISVTLLLSGWSGCAVRHGTASPTPSPAPISSSAPAPAR